MRYNKKDIVYIEDEKAQIEYIVDNKHVVYKLMHNGVFGIINIDSKGINYGRCESAKDEIVKNNGGYNSYYDFKNANSFDEFIDKFGFNNIEESIVLTILTIASNRSLGDIDDFISDSTDVDSLSENMCMYFSEGTVLKSLIGMAKSRRDGEPRHSGTSYIRDSEKVRHYMSIISKRLA